MKGTIKGKGEIEELFKSGKRIKLRGAILIASTKDGGRGQVGRVAFIAGRKIGNAPKRNFSKRRLRHVAKILGLPPVGYDIVFIARKQTATMDFSDLVESCKRALEDEGILGSVISSGNE